MKGSLLILCLCVTISTWAQEPVSFRDTLNTNPLSIEPTTSMIAAFDEWNAIISYIDVLEDDQPENCVTENVASPAADYDFFACILNDDFRQAQPVRTVLYTGLLYTHTFPSVSFAVQRNGETIRLAHLGAGELFLAIIILDEPADYEIALRGYNGLTSDPTTAAVRFSWPLDDTVTQTTRSTALYQINIKPGTNIRDSASTSANIVGTATQGVIYEVFSETPGDQYTWLEIQHNNEAAYVAKILTTRLPDYTLVADGVPLPIPGTNCIADHATQRNRRRSIHVMFGNNADNKLFADIYKPGADSPVPVYRSDYEVSQAVTYQRYSQWWGEGVYTVSFLNRDTGQETIMGFHIQGTKTNFIRVRCDNE